MYERIRKNGIEQLPRTRMNAACSFQMGWGRYIGFKYSGTAQESSICDDIRPSTPQVPGTPLWYYYYKVCGPVVQSCYFM